MQRIKLTQLETNELASFIDKRIFQSVLADLSNVNLTELSDNQVLAVNISPQGMFWTNVDLKEPPQIQSGDGIDVGSPISVSVDKTVIRSHKPNAFTLPVSGNKTASAYFTSGVPGFIFNETDATTPDSAVWRFFVNNDTLHFDIRDKSGGETMEWLTVSRSKSMITDIALNTNTLHFITHKMGFFNAQPVERPTVSGTTTDPVLKSLVAALAKLGLVEDNVTTVN